MGVLALEKIDFKTKIVMSDEEGHYIMIQKSVHKKI